MIASPALSPILAWASGGKLKNWAGNIEYGTDRFKPPLRWSRCRDYVKTQDKLKVLGTRHCFNTIADSRDQSPIAEADGQSGALDPGAHGDRRCGHHYGQLCPYLDSKGFALHNLASLPHISVAGACSTATHGSGQKNGNLATAVSALEIVTAAGEVVKLSAERTAKLSTERWSGLGALGVITRVTLDIQPTFHGAPICV